MNFRNIFKKKIPINVQEIVNSIEKEKIVKRYMILIFALFLSALSFNLFFYEAKIVVGGISGLSIIINEFLNINPSTFILIVNIGLLFVSYIFLGIKTTLKTVVAIIVYPLFISLTENVSILLNFENIEPLILTLYGGILSGIASGLIFKVGFSAGGTDILVQIIHKYFKISIGNSSLFINTIIIGCSGFVFGWENVMYAIIALYISSIMTDKVLLGISGNKAFFIITSKENEIKEFIIENLKHSVTILQSQGGFTNKNKNVLMAVIPTKEYFIFKESISKIDGEAFFVVTDSYQVYGGE